MFKKKVISFIYISIIFILLSGAGALEKYTVPKQKVVIVIPTDVNKLNDVYDKFKSKVSNLSKEARDKLKKYYHNKLKEDIAKENFDNAKYYKHLLNILEQYN